MFCPACGQENAVGSKFCVTCGASLPAFSDWANATVSPGVVRPSVEYAGFWLRFAASIIDGLLVSAVFWVVWAIIGFDFQFGFGDPYDYSAISMPGWFGAMMLISLIVPWLYYTIMEASALQATLGKLVFGIKVTDEAGNRVSFLRATGRYFGKIISQAIFYIGFLMIAFTGKKQGLHDMLAGTLVVKK